MTTYKKPPWRTKRDALIKAAFANLKRFMTVKQACNVIGPAHNIAPASVENIVYDRYERRIK